jgi:hypothetical protein
MVIPSRRILLLTQPRAFHVIVFRIPNGEARTGRERQPQALGDHEEGPNRGSVSDRRQIIPIRHRSNKRIFRTAREE